MKRLLFWLIILFLAVWAGIIIQSHPGYVLVVVDQISIETTPWVALFFIFLAFLIFALFFKIFNYTLNFPTSFQHWSFQRKQRKARHLTHKGLYELAEGDWHTAEKALKKSAKKSETPLINYLAAAQAAQKQGEIAERDYYLKEAAQLDGNFEIAVSLTQAKLQLECNQLEQALATLQHLQQLAPSHTYVLSLLQSVYLQLNDYAALLKLLPDLRRYKVLNSNELEKLEVVVYKKLLIQTIQHHQNIEMMWQKIPKSLREHPELLTLYIQQLNEVGQSEQAEELLKSTLKKKWNLELIRLYAHTQSAKPSKQLRLAEHWLKSHPNDPDLLFTLGQLSMREKLWGKARNYFETCLSIKPSALVYVELGKLAEKLNNKE